MHRAAYFLVQPIYGLIREQKGLGLAAPTIREMASAAKPNMRAACRLFGGLQCYMNPTWTLVSEAYRMLGRPFLYSRTHSTAGSDSLAGDSTQRRRSTRSWTMFQQIAAPLYTASTWSSPWLLPLLP